MQYETLRIIKSQIKYRANVISHVADWSTSQLVSLLIATVFKSRKY